MRHPWVWVVPTVVVAVGIFGVAAVSIGRSVVDDPPVTQGGPSVSPGVSPSVRSTPLSDPTLTCTASQLQGTVVYRPSVAAPTYQSKNGKLSVEQFPFEIEVVNMSTSDCVMLSSPQVKWMRPHAAPTDVVMALTDARGQAPLPAGAGVFAAVEVAVPASCSRAQSADDGNLALTVVQGQPTLPVPLRRLADCAASGPMVIWPFTPDLAAADHDLRNAGWVVDPRGTGDN